MKKVLFILFLLFFALPVFADQIDINSANLSQLDEIVHVGPKTAQKIIDGRPYSSINDLSRVKGIGSGKYLQDIINQGFACVNCQTEIDQTPTPMTAITPAPTPTPTASQTLTLVPATIYPGGIFINEILPNPAGADETNEWIVPTIQQIASVYS
ncbi:MAG: helix-hairpin-helix domain-containing protein [Candidatus Staskawiczbacteria bacterium]|jgi:hypothetical protein